MIPQCLIKKFFTIKVSVKMNNNQNFLFLYSFLLFNHFYPETMIWLMRQRMTSELRSYHTHAPSAHSLVMIQPQLWRSIINQYNHLLCSITNRHKHVDCHSEKNRNRVQMSFYSKFKELKVKDFGFKNLF